jgi:ribosomal protein S18 acetylase RimI-like enzyme
MLQLPNDYTMARVSHPRPTVYTDWPPLVFAPRPGPRFREIAAVIEIRPYQEHDHDGMVALWEQVFPEAARWNDPATDIRRKLAVQRELFFVAVDGDEVVGSVMAGFDGHRGWLYRVAVRADHRRQGIGARLLRKAENALAKRGCHKVNLQVLVSNPDAVEFYKHLGYSVEPRVNMAKRLK